MNENIMELVEAYKDGIISKEEVEFALACESLEVDDSEASEVTEKAAVSADDAAAVLKKATAEFKKLDKEYKDQMKAGAFGDATKTAKAMKKVLSDAKAFVSKMDETNGSASINAAIMMLKTLAATTSITLPKAATAIPVKESAEEDVVEESDDATVDILTGTANVAKEIKKVAEGRDKEVAKEKKAEKIETKDKSPKAKSNARKAVGKKALIGAGIAGLAAIGAAAVALKKANDASKGENANETIGKIVKELTKLEVYVASLETAAKKAGKAKKVIKESTEETVEENVGLSVEDIIDAYSEGAINEEEYDILMTEFFESALGDEDETESEEAGEAEAE